MLSCEQFELAPQRCEAAGLDLDQQVAADEIDDETVNDPFDAIAGASVPLLELSVQCTLVERSDRRDLTFLGSGDLKDRAHDDAPSAPRRSCLPQVTGGPGRRPPTDVDAEGMRLWPTSQDRSVSSHWCSASCSTEGFQPKRRKNSRAVSRALSRGSATSSSRGRVTASMNGTGQPRNRTAAPAKISSSSP